MWTGPRVVALALLAVFGVFWVWYGGSGEPLTRQEAEALLAAMESHAQERGRADPELVESLRALAQQDDGAEFFMLNLMRYREKAVYPPGYDYDDDVRAAADRYDRLIAPALLRRAALPVFLGAPAGTFLQPEGADVWDDVALVRYRSRRDLLEMAVELSARDVVVHKWASIEKTQVFPVKSRFDFVFVRSAVGALLLGIAGLFKLLWVWRAHRAVR